MRIRRINAHLSDALNIKLKDFMAEEIKTKSVSLGTLKAKDANGERRIQFVASSNQEDRHGERVDVASLRLPLKSGGEIAVSQIGEDGVEGVDVPLMLNHSFDVKDVIGSVRKAFYQDGELVFEAGFSKGEIAQNILTLLEEGHLSNAFSITMSDFDYDPETAVISNAEVIEVSVVFRGANKEARLLAIKDLLGGEQMEEAEKVETPAVEDEKVETPVVEEESSDKEEAEVAEEKQDDKGEETVEKDAEPTEEVAETPEETLNEEKEESEMDKEIAKDTVAPKATPVQAVKNSDYLKSKEALKDFKNIVMKFHRGSNEQIMKAWMDNLKAKNVGGDAILPARIEQIFFKTWVDKAEILNTFRNLGVRSGAVYAMKATANGTAQKHAKGASKVNQEIEAIRRDLKGLCIYKKLPIDLQDLYDDETGELLAFRVEELAGRVAHAIVVGAIVGGYIDANGRGLFSMASDLDNTAESGDTGDFAKAVATVVVVDANDTDLAKAIKTVGAVKGGRRILIAGDGWMTNARIALLGMNYPVADIAEFVGADEIHELEEISTSGYDLIAYSRDAYVLAGERNATVRTDFDLTKNEDVMLVERYVAGSITGYKNVAGYPASES